MFMNTVPKTSMKTKNIKNSLKRVTESKRPTPLGL